MGSRNGFVLILQSGAGGYLGCTEVADAYDDTSHVGGDGWIFRFQFVGHQTSRHRRSRPLVKLRQVSTLGCPSATAMPTALQSAGNRHCVEYALECE
jgi:hypothetical protein